MKIQESIQYVREEDVKFIRLAFCDVFGRQKNISIMPAELPRALEFGIAIDASAIAGFSDEEYSDLFLHPDADPLMHFAVETGAWQCSTNVLRHHLSEWQNI